MFMIHNQKYHKSLQYRHQHIDHRNLDILQKADSEFDSNTYSRNHDQHILQPSPFCQRWITDFNLINIAYLAGVCLGDIH